MIVFRFAVSAFALLLIVLGVALTISPIPFGFVLVFFGLALFAAVAPAEVRWLRKRWRWFDRVMHRLEKRLPEWIAKRLRASDYDHEEDEEEEAPSKRPMPRRRRSA